MIILILIKILIFFQKIGMKFIRNLEISLKIEIKLFSLFLFLFFTFDFTLLKINNN